MPEVLALFDVDGTLIDSAPLIVDTMARAFASAGLPAPDPCAVRARIGISLPLMVAGLIPDHPQTVQDGVVDGYRQAFAAAMDAGPAPPLYPGVARGLAQLTSAGVTLGIATGKSRRGVERLLSEHDWRPLFATCQCADDHPSKPHPSMILTAIRDTGATAAGTVMIGDSIYDMQMARAAAVQPLGVSWGYASPDDLAASGAGDIATDFGDLVHTLLKRHS
ncbi:HAD-IA family hydrolase [Jannaschia sp. 2305UL9-9]|uniref:HAD-IA family hydrolase n=1 Tax=Jannaschia sp. 2305UL9-9 TaxID=3121638 RepID=UPI003526E301